MADVWQQIGRITAARARGRAMDGLTALRLHMEWGADEALDEGPVDRFVATMPAAHLGITSAAQLDTAPARRPVAPHPVLSALADIPALATSAAAAAPDLAALHAAMNAFDACPLRATASSTVAPSGNADSGLLLVADAPGAEDDRAGMAFSGRAGAQLDRILATAGLSRDMLLLAPMVPWRPPGGRAPNEAEVAICLPFLLRLIELARPRRIVALGALPLHALMGGDSGRRRARGTWVDATIPGISTSIPILRMLPPEQWLSSAANKQATWSDLLSLHVTDASKTGF